VSARRRPLGHAIVGLGLMGRTHLRALDAVRRAGFGARLVAVCDRHESRLSGRVPPGGNLPSRRGARRLFDPAQLLATSDFDELLADERVDSVSICTHTDSHVELALRALAAGKHVLVEKPVALEPAAVRSLARAAAKARRIAMPAMCMRYWPGWDWLAARVRDRRFGRVRSAVFQRLASAPDWATDFYADARRSGGALVDLHIHDADFVRWLFGAPRALISAGSLEHVTTLYHFARGPAHVVAEGGWDHSEGFPFRMRYLVVFERATADFELGRAAPLLLHRGGKSTPVALAPGDGYRGELRAFLRAVSGGARAGLPTMDEAAAVMELLAAERSALGLG